MFYGPLSVLWPQALCRMNKQTLLASQSGLIADASCPGPTQNWQPPSHLINESAVVEAVCKQCLQNPKGPTKH